MPKSVLEAIKMGIWDFEPPEIEFSQVRCGRRHAGHQREAERAGRAGQARASLVARARSRRLESPPPRQFAPETAINRLCQFLV